MVDPTGLNEQLKRKNAKSANLYGKTFGTGLLGGIIGGVVFLALKGVGSIDCFPLFILSGIGIVAMYLYFTDSEERKNRQIPFLFLAGIVSVVVILFLYILISLYKSGAGVTLSHIFQAYFQNTADSFGESTLFFHLVALFFEALGIGLAWLYVSISVPRWERKHGKDEPKGIRRRRR